MEQFDKWHEYWERYLLEKHGKQEVANEDDLYLQVARTVHRKPISKEAFQLIVDDIIQSLSLQQDDVLVDFCCGNGLFTYELKDKVARIIGIDFTEQIVATARQLKSAPNIEYCLGSVVDFMDAFEQHFPGVHPHKYLMNDSISYFSVKDLEQMLKSMIRVSPNGFTAIFRGAPDDALKWNYYNTEERKQRYLDNLAKGDLTNDGMGRWWAANEVETVCASLGLVCHMRQQDAALANYRTDIIIKFQ